jgi:hypothetical protein
MRPVRSVLIVLQQRVTSLYLVGALHRQVSGLFGLEKGILVRTTRIIPRIAWGSWDHGVYVSCGWHIVHDWSRIVTTGVATNGVIASENCTDDNDNCNDRADEPPRPSVGSVAYQTVIRVIH